MAEDDYLWQKIKEELTCSICLSVFRDPRQLPCQHSFCVGCLRGLTVMALPGPHPGTHFHGIGCPICRRNYPLPDAGVECFPVDFKLANFLGLYQNRNGTNSDRSMPDEPDESTEGEPVPAGNTEEQLTPSSAEPTTRPDNGASAERTEAPSPRVSPQSAGSEEDDISSRLALVSLDGSAGGRRGRTFGTSPPNGGSPPSAPFTALGSHQYLRQGQYRPYGQARTTVPVWVVCPTVFAAPPHHPHPPPQYPLPPLHYPHPPHHPPPPHHFHPPHPLPPHHPSPPQTTHIAAVVASPARAHTPAPHTPLIHLIPHALCQPQHPHPHPGQLQHHAHPHPHPHHWLPSFQGQPPLYRSGQAQTPPRYRQSDRS